ncbi:MAG: efflux RND transporter periplasmic adaptor subunit [Vicinamibacterales bacterium]
MRRRGRARDDAGGAGARAHDRHGRDDAGHRVVRRGRRARRARDRGRVQPPARDRRLRAGRGRATASAPARRWSRWTRPTLDAQLARARAGLAAARATAASAGAERDAAVAGRELARATHDRIQRLFADQSATAQERDQAVAALRATDARLTSATAGAQAAQEGVAAAESAVRAAEVARGWATIAAPFDGLVAARQVDPGTTATPGAPLVTIESAGALELEVRLDAGRAAAIHRGQAVDGRVEAGGVAGEWRPGRVTEIARVDPAGHSFVVTIAFDATDAAWRSGLFGRARFRGDATDRLTVPAAAVVTRGQLTFVYLIDADGRARLRAVTAADPDGDRREILAGLGAGDRVVVDPPADLSDGTPVSGAGPAGVSPGPAPGAAAATTGAGR